MESVYPVRNRAAPMTAAPYKPLSKLVWKGKQTKNEFVIKEQKQKRANQPGLLTPEDGGGAPTNVKPPTSWATSGSRRTGWYPFRSFSVMMPPAS